MDPTLPEDDYRIQILAEVPGLTDAPPSALAELARWWEVREVNDAPICQEREAAETLFVLAEGSAIVLKTAANGRRYQVATLTPGCLFGHVSVMTLARRTASVRAVGPVKLLQMTARRAREVLRSDNFLVASPFRRALIVAMSRQLYAATATTMKLAFDAGLTSPGVTAPARPITEPLAPPDDLTDEEASQQITIASGHL